MESRPYSWEELHALSDKLAHKIIASGQQIDVIVGIARTGLLPAMLMAFIFDTRNVLTISVRTTATDIPSAERIAPILGSGLRREDIEHRRCLLVDDVIDTGATMRTAKRALEDLGASSVITSALIWSRVASRQGGQEPDCAADFWIDELDVWAAVPWEPKV